VIGVSLEHPFAAGITGITALYLWQTHTDWKRNEEWKCEEDEHNRATDAANDN
jgi:hypothetical protein